MGFAPCVWNPVWIKIIFPESEINIPVSATLFVTPLPHCKVGEDLVCGRQVLRGDPVRTQRQDQRCGRRHQGAGRHCR